ncbi:MAG TPA: hypothetical protein ENI07_16940 [Desulfobacterales bacterium]|nr:hypothetical protein [Desulfobacterales bacterium]
MRRILRDNMRMMVAIGVFLAIVTVAKVGWGQEPPKPLTPEQKIESLTNSILNLKLDLAAEKHGYGQELKIVVDFKAHNMLLQKIVKELQAKLKAANAEIAQLTVKPKEEKKDEKAPDNGAVD